MAGAEATPLAGGADASARLRAWCLSAAVGIRDECGRALGAHEVASLAGAHVKERLRVVDRAGDDSGVVREDGDDMTGAGSSSSSARTSLEGCGEPLVHLLSRQASRVVGLYESEPQASYPSSATPMLPALSADSAKLTDEAQQPDAVRPFSPGVDGRQHAFHRQATRSGENGGSEPTRATDDLVLKRLDDLLSIAYARFYAYMYKDLPLCWRQLYTDAAILKFSLLLLATPFCGRRQQPGVADVDVDHAACLAPDGGPEHGDTARTDGLLTEMIKTLDLALILAGAGGHARGRAWIDRVFELLESACTAAGGTWATSAAKTGHEHAGEVVGASVGDAQPPAKRAKLLESPVRPAAAPWAGQPSFSPHEPFTPPTRHPIRRVSAEAMDMSAFQRHLDGGGASRGAGPEPLVLTGLVDHWPARAGRPWAKPSYLLSRTFAGRRLVPVEVGRSYVDEGWGQKIVSFGEFLSMYIDPSSTSSASAEASTEASHVGPSEGRPTTTTTAYLAQHQLFLQLPQLRGDILVPDHCYTAPPAHPTDASRDQPELDEPLLNAWLGPPGTITPLHTDPYHNLLVQVVGRKYVRLYAPHQTGRMRARGKEGGVEMGNTSLWDVGVLEGWDARPGVGGGGGDDEDDDEGEGEGDGEEDEAVGAGQENRAGGEDFKEIPFMDCILEPGDTLYIPIGWWHYVRGLSVSFSVSIWWN